MFLVIDKEILVFPSCCSASLAVDQAGENPEDEWEKMGGFAFLKYYFVLCFHLMNLLFLTEQKSREQSRGRNLGEETPFICELTPAVLVLGFLITLLSLHGRER